MEVRRGSGRLTTQHLMGKALRRPPTDPSPTREHTQLLLPAPPTPPRSPGSVSFHSVSSPHLVSTPEIFRQWPRYTGDPAGELAVLGGVLGLRRGQRWLGSHGSL